MIVLSAKKHIEILKDKISENKHTIVSLHPEVSIELEKLGIKYVFPEQFSGLNSINKKCLETYKYLRKLCDEFDEKLKIIDFFKDISPVFFSYYFFWIEVMLNTVTANIYLIKNMLEKLKPEKIYIIKQDEDKIDERLFFYNISYLFYQIFLLYSEKIQIITVPDEKEISNFKQEAIRKKNIYEKLSYLKNMTLSFFKKIKIKYLKRNICFITYYNHDVPYLSEYLKKEYKLELYHIKFNFLKKYKNKLKSDKIIEKIFYEIENNLKRFCILDNIEFYSIIDKRIKRLKQFFENIYEQSIDNYNRLKFFNNVKKTILTPASNLNPKLFPFIFAAKKYKIPIITYQEGAGYSGVPYCPQYDFTEYFNSDYFLSYGNTKEYLYSVNIQQTSKIIEVGSLRLKKFKENMNNTNNNKYKICYATTTFQINSHYPFNNSFANMFLENQKKIINFLDSLNISVALQIKPNCNEFISINNYIKKNKNKYKNITLIESFPFVEVIKNSDSIILDFPSTILLEALLTEKPIFIFSDGISNCILKEANEILSKRCGIYKTIEDLEIAVKDYMINKKINFNVKNKEAFYKYCLDERETKIEEKLKAFFDNFYERK